MIPGVFVLWGQMNIHKDDNKTTDKDLRVAFFVSGYGLGTSASIVNSAIMFAQSGYQVDLFLCYVPDSHLVTFRDERICVHDLGNVPQTSVQFISKVGHFVKVVLRAIIPAKGRAKLRKLLKRRRSHEMASSCPGESEFGFIPETALDAAAEVISDNDYQCFFGIEQRGLIFAGWLGAQFNVPVVYYSLELYLSNYPHWTGDRFPLLKHLERKYHAAAIATIIQDEERGRLLLADNGITQSRMFYVPVAMLGEPIQSRGRYFHNRFGLPNSERIILQLGNIHEHRQSQQIAKAAQTLPNGWTLVMHGLIKPDMAEEISKLDVHSKIRLSRDLVDMHDLPELVSSADIGLVFYTDDNLNNYHTGLASDKMARHMQCGTPVITIDFPSFRRIVDKYKCGICVSDPQEMPHALRQIEADYESYRAGAFRCFADNYEFSRHFRSVVEFVSQLG